MVGLDMISNVLVMETVMDSEAMLHGLCKQILTCTASEIVMLDGIKGFLDSLFSDNLRCEMNGGGGHVIVRK